MVHVGCGEAAFSALQKAGVQSQYECIEGLGHCSCVQELRIVARFAHKSLTPKDVAPDVADWKEDDDLALLAGSSDSDSEDDGVIYVGKTALDALKAQLSKGIGPSHANVSDLVNFDSVEGDEVV